MQWDQNKIYIVLMFGLLLGAGCLEVGDVSYSECLRKPENSSARALCLTNHATTLIRNEWSVTNSIAVCESILHENEKYKCHYACAIEAARISYYDDVPALKTGAQNHCNKIDNSFNKYMQDDSEIIKNHCFTDIAVQLKDESLCNYMSDEDLNFYGAFQILNKTDLIKVCKEKVTQKINQKVPFE